MPDSDRRRWKRLRAELPLQVQLLGDENSMAALGSHMNPEGIFVRIAPPPELGARVRVTLNAEGTHGVLTGEGDVVDRVGEQDAAGRPPGVGIKFDRVGPAWQKLYQHLSLE